METFRTGLKIARNFTTKTRQINVIQKKRQNHVFRHGYHKAHNLYSQETPSVQGLIKNLLKPSKVMAIDCKEAIRRIENNTERNFAGQSYYGNRPADKLVADEPIDKNENKSEVTNKRKYNETDANVSMWEMHTESPKETETIKNEPLPAPKVGGIEIVNEVRIESGDIQNYYKARDAHQHPPEKKCYQTGNNTVLNILANPMHNRGNYIKSSEVTEPIELTESHCDELSEPHQASARDYMNLNTSNYNITQRREPARMEYYSDRCESDMSWNATDKMQRYQQENLPDELNQRALAMFKDASQNSTSFPKKNRRIPQTSAALKAVSAPEFVNNETQFCSSRSYRSNPMRDETENDAMQPADEGMRTGETFYGDNSHYGSQVANALNYHHWRNYTVAHNSSSNLRLNLRRFFRTGGRSYKDEPPCVKPRPPVKPCKVPEPPKWSGCDKICMPCCKPQEICEKEGIKERTCSGPQYRLPAFTECNHAPLPQIRPRECYDWTRFCPQDRIGMEVKKPFITVKERTDRVLGRKTKEDACSAGRKFSTFTQTLYAKGEDEKDCKKLKTGLPCLKPSDIIGGKKPSKSNKACEKICMPCCAPARDPPECFTPFIRPECKKYKPPRPAYSECKKAIYKKKPCECDVQRPPPCDKK